MWNRCKDNYLDAIFRLDVLLITVQISPVANNFHVRKLHTKYQTIYWKHGSIWWKTLPRNEQQACTKQWNCKSSSKWVFIFIYDYTYWYFNLYLFKNFIPLMKGVSRFKHIDDNVLTSNLTIILSIYCNSSSWETSLTIHIN